MDKKSLKSETLFLPSFQQLYVSYLFLSALLPIDLCFSSHKSIKKEFFSVAEAENLADSRSKHKADD